MAISGTTSDTSGRTQDILIFQGLNPNILNTPQAATISFGTSSSYITGIQKLVQRFAVVFLTSLSSQPDYPTFGTSFSSSVASGLAGIDGVALQHAFNFAVLNTQQVFTDYQKTTTGLPLDEQLAGAVLLDFSYTAGSLALTIGITSLAGTTVQYVLHFPG